MNLKPAEYVDSSAGSCSLSLMSCQAVIVLGVLALKVADSKSLKIRPPFPGGLSELES